MPFAETWVVPVREVGCAQALETIAQLKIVPSRRTLYACAAIALAFSSASSMPPTM